MTNQFTTHSYLNKMIAIAIEDGTITVDDIYRLVDLYGSSHQDIAIDILSIVHQRRKDKAKLEELQEIYRNGLHSS